ncbi:erythromycin esterase family protein [Nonomuraea sp. NPDC049709]|uniref:erythromycin esterase family protein n=1 Tax=Nonomuraea sp. NPDC049709 TaxID=3154736 RepID=UPI00342A2BBF
MFRLFVAGVLAATPAAIPAATPAATPAAHPEVVDWLRQNARPQVTREMIGDATVVGLGESSHGTHEESTLKFRTLRLLVTELGFRSIAWEEDWTTGVRVNRYVLTGEGDLDALMRELTTTWQTAEVREVLAWLRAYNAGHDDKVRFVGVEYYATRSLAYDAVSSYVTKVAPALLGKLGRHLEPIRPRHEDTHQNLMWYLDVTDKSSYIRHARAVYELVARLPRTRQQRLAVQHARQILSWYEGFSLRDNYAYRDSRAAENLRWWQRYTGDKVAYWAASAHTAAAPRLRVTLGEEAITFDSAGSHLRRWYGDRYRSVGVLFDHGTLNAGRGCGTAPAPVPRPDPGFANRVFGAAGLDEYAVDLGADAPGPVRAWLRGPAKVRGYAAYEPARPQGSYMSGGSLARWFDVIVHRQVITPCTPLPARP